MIKIKQFIKNNWMMTLIYTLGLFGAIIAGWLLGGKATMLHATAFPNSNVTYNEGQFLNYYDGTNNNYLTINYTEGYNSSVQRYKITIIFYSTNYGGSGSTQVYTDCTLNNNNLNCPYRYSISANTSTNSNVISNTNTWTINNNSIVYNNSTTYNIVSSGYTEDQYLAYGTQQYNLGYSTGVAYVQAHPAEYNLYTSAQYSANYTAGQNAVINSPNTYNLYTQAQYEANYTSGYNAGVTYVQNHPSEYNLYTSAQYTAYGTAQYTAGQNAVINSPNTYNLYTQAQYNSYGTTQFSAGENAVQNDPHTYGLYTSTDMTNNYNAGVQYVLDHPSEYNLYTTAQYNAHAQEQYNAGYLAGQQASTNYQDGIQYVLDHLDEYGLYTTQEYNSYGVAQYIAGQNSVINNPNEYGLYNEVQLETAEQTSYSDGYQDGIDSFSSNNVVIPTFNILNQNMAYGCSNNQFCSGTNVPDNNTNIPTIKFSDYMPYTNVKFNVDNGSNEIGYNIDLYNYWVFFSTSYSASGTLAIPESVSDVYIKFCNSTSSYYIMGQEYKYCNSISTNVESYTPSGQWLGIESIYDNLGIYVGNIDTIENGYRLIDLSNYLVGEYNNYQWLEITLGNANDIHDQYDDLEIHYSRGSLDAEAYNTGYQQGYDKGNQIGQATAKQIYYSQGYEAGFNKSRTIGDSSLVGITGTILSAPVNMFKSMFNVEFLGVNLAGFILSIVTLFIAIWLIKKFL